MQEHTYEVFQEDEPMTPRATHQNQGTYNLTPPRASKRFRLTNKENFEFVDDADGPGRSKAVAACEAGVEMPVTPRSPQSQIKQASTPPPLVRRQVTPLWKALCTNSVLLVRAALLQNPEDAWQPFWDYNGEFPLAFARSQGCSSEIIDVLMQYGAEDPFDSRDIRIRPGPLGEVGKVSN